MSIMSAQATAGSIPVPETSSGKPKIYQTTKFKIGAVVGAIVLILILRWVYGLFTTETTDDAFITSRVHQISTRVQGQVLSVYVGDNQKVKAGDVLMTLDPREFEANVKSAQAKYAKAHKDLGRLSGVTEFLPDEKPLIDQYQADALSSEATLQEATLQYQFTKIVAPTDGTVGARNVETGQLVVPGQALMALVEPNPWIVANFKEGQLAKIRVGQKVEIEVDAIPGHTFEGKVDSVSPGSGATFSLLPPDNATGNFTKVVQRVPVKITFTPESLKGYEDRVVAGLSTYVSIKVN